MTSRTRLRSAVAPKPATLGFLTIVEDPSRGFIGGCLVTNLWGRPLEFQCTSPVRPNRAQEILYGATLREFVFGELIAPALLTKTKLAPEAVVTDRAELLCMRPQVALPVIALVEETAQPQNDSPTFAQGGSPQSCGDFDASPWTVHPHHAEDRDRFSALLRTGQCLTDLREPFGRIVACIGEVYR